MRERVLMLTGLQDSVLSLGFPAGEFDVRKLNMLAILLLVSGEKICP